MIMMKKTFFPVILVLCLLLGTWGTAQAAPASTGSIGYVDFLYLIDHHPDTVQANAILKAEQETAKQEYESKAPSLSEQDKQILDRQLGQKLEQKRRELVKAISLKVVATANEVLKEKGLSIVIGNKDIVCGGVDITEDVVKKFSTK